MRAEIISVGTELLLGDIVNSNAQFLAQQLAGLGYSVFYQTVVGDNIGRLRALVQEAKSRSDVLVFTGGLGPTEDDLTKEVVAEAFGDTLVLDEEELASLEDFFKKRGVPMGANNRKQAMVPRRGYKLPNPNGTAPGAYFRQGGKYAILLPGPPREMKPMFLEQAAPILESMQDAAIHSVTLRVFGIGESALEDKVFDLLTSSNPTAALYAKTGEVHIRVTARAPTAEQADLMCDDTVLLFKRILGDLVYSDNGDDLETTAVKLLAGQNATVATAESCTGGLLGERITSVAGASGVYGYGAITYANEAKHQMLRVSNATLRRYGAVSSQVAGEMALGAMRKAGDDYGIGITGIAGPDGGSVNKPVGLVYVALAHGRDVFVKKLSINDRGREYVRELATQHALDMLRRVILGLDIPDAKLFGRLQEADYERVGRPRRRGGPVLRAVGAVLLTALLFVLLVWGIYSARESAGKNASAAAAASPSASGLVYGTEEYTKAACKLVASAKADNPAVVGFVALPGAGEDTIENLVGKPSTGSQQTLENALGTAGLQDMAVVAPGAAPAKPAGNTLVLGADSLAGLLELQNTSNAPAISTFTYYTASDAKVYQVFAVLLNDADEPAADGFDPATEQVTGYAGYLAHMLGAKVRSVYDIPVAPSEDGSYMTLAVTDPEVEGRRFYLCGQLVPAGETPQQVVAVPAADPLMPAAWYSQQAEPATVPEMQSAYESRLRQYLGRTVTNSELQLMCGIPDADAYPMVDPPAQAPIVITPSTSTPAVTVAPSSSSAGQSENTASASSATDASSQSQSNASPDNSGNANTDSQSGSGSDQSSSSSSQSVAMPDELIIPVPSQPTIYIPPAAQPQKADPATLTVTMDGQVVTGPAADILAQVCQAEVPGADTAVVKAVAVAAHSWILNMQGAGYAAPPLAGRQPSAVVRAAVAEVVNQVLSDDNKNPAFCPWTKMAANGTATAKEVFGVERSYLGSVTSPYEQNLEGWRASTALTAEEVAALARKNLGVDLAEFGTPDIWFADVVKDDAGYVQSLRLGGVELTGLDLWQRVLVGENGPLLPSAAFEVGVDGDKFEFVTYGRGHGCGLSLAGAASYAREGWSYDRILEHYYPGTKLMPLE